MNKKKRSLAHEIAYRHLDADDALGWFEALYAEAADEAGIIPWVDFKPNPNLTAWLDRAQWPVSGRALVVGSGLGDDAEELFRRGFEVTAFDISQTAIAWTKRRFSDSNVDYVAADVLDAPGKWRGHFDFVLESDTLQVLPPDLRVRAMASIASFVAPGGLLLALGWGRDPDDPLDEMPWPLTQDELALFENHGLKLLRLEDYFDDKEPPKRRFRAVYRKRA